MASVINKTHHFQANGTLIRKLYLMQLSPICATIVFFLQLIFNFVITGETCEVSNTLTKSPCRMPCEKDEDCINHGRHTCCPTLPGSSCMGECFRGNLKSNRATKSKCFVSRGGRATLHGDACCTF